MREVKMMQAMIVSIMLLLLSLGSARSDPDAASDWPMYGKNLVHSFSNPHSDITPRNVSTLVPSWTFATGDAVTASPAVVDGVLYVGAWDGFFYALDARTGSLRWRFQLDCQPAVVPLPQVCGGPGPGTATPERFSTPGGIVTASAAVVDDSIYFGGGRTLYRLSRDDGHLIWKHVTCGNPEDPNCLTDAQDPLQILSSPAVYGGKIFFGVAAGGVNFGIPYRGGFLALDTRTGAQVWRFEVDVQAATTGQNRGCGDVWSSPAVDTERGMVFFGTADCEEQPLPPYHESVLALDLRTGAVRWVFRPRETDPNKCDFDFAASPNLINVGGRLAVGIGGKDGTYYLLDRLTGASIWSRRVVFGGDTGGFFGGAAFDGRRIFSATAFGDGNVQTQSGLCSPSYVDPTNPNVVDTFIQDPSMHSISALTGDVLNERSDNQSFGATTLAKGVVFSGFIGQSATNLPAVKAYRASTLAPLLVIQSAVNGVPGMVNSAVVTVGSSIYFGSGNYFDGTGAGVHAYVLPGSQ